MEQAGVQGDGGRGTAHLGLGISRVEQGEKPADGEVELLGYAYQSVLVCCSFGGTCVHGNVGHLLGRSIQLQADNFGRPLRVLHRGCSGPPEDPIRAVFLMFGVSEPLQQRCSTAAVRLEGRVEGAVNSAEVSGQDSFAERLLEWWRKSKLDFEWRAWRDPYRVLIAEVLLRRTQAEKVAVLVDAVIEEIGSLEKLLAASRDRLEEVLRPFGMSRKKAQELKALAEKLHVEFGGRVPETLESLVSLPGVGNYIASAVLCFGYGKKKAVVDTNVVRVYQRVFRLESSRARPREDPLFWEFADRMLPESNWREFNYALIDFAKLVCRARKPLCTECPLTSICACWSGDDHAARQPAE